MWNVNKMNHSDGYLIEMNGFYKTIFLNAMFFHIILMNFFKIIGKYVEKINIKIVK